MPTACVHVYNKSGCGVHHVFSSHLRALSPTPKLAIPSACFLLTLEIPLDGGRAGGAAMIGAMSSSFSPSLSFRSDVDAAWCPRPDEEVARVVDGSPMPSADLWLSSMPWLDL
jgi:hypothetical protein